MRWYRACFGLAVLAVVGLLGCSTDREAKVADPAAANPALKPYEEAASRGAEWLLAQEKENGSFGGQAEVGFASLALSAILKSPDAAKYREDPRVKKAVDFLVASQQPDGSINPSGEKGLANYQTSAALAALAAWNDPAQAEAREKATKFLLSIQTTEGLDAGGFGYNRHKRADLSNTQFSLDALKAAGLDEKSEAFKNCVQFLQRCQNRSESNDQLWATNDGGGVYYPGASEAGLITLPNGKVVYRSYGSMTYALLRGYLLVGLKADDPRVQAAQKWITEHYAVDENPGMEKGKETQGLYYYLLSMAKALSLLGRPTLTLPSGTEVNWAKDVAGKLVKLQTKDGYWVNEADRWLEGDKVLVTAYALITLNDCRAALAKEK